MKKAKANKKTAKRKAAKTRSKKTLEKTSGAVAQSGVTKLEVCLHTSANPPVFISDRKKKVSGAGKIMWSRVSGAPSFSFEDFSPTAAPFLNVVVKPQKIECDFQPAATDPPGTEHPYTITVKNSSGSHSSDELVQSPTGGRAVIRN